MQNSIKGLSNSFSFSVVGLWLLCNHFVHVVMSTREIRKKKRTSVISISKKKLSIDKSVDKSLKKTNDDRGRSPTRNKESNAKVERRGSSAGRVRPSGIDLQTVKPAASGPISARRRLKRSQFREDDITFGIASFQSSQNGKGAVLDSVSREIQ